MGSLTSRPKIQAQPKVVYVSSPAPAANTPPPATTPASSQDTGSGGFQSPAEVRAENLLLRDRGVFGTVLTGFRGLLAPMDNAGARKTLLGE